MFPPAPSMRLITDMVSWSVAEIPKWNPIKSASTPAGSRATPAQELALPLHGDHRARLGADSGQVPADRFGDVVGRISFFVNAGLRFIEEMCKMRALARLWDEITAERYGISTPSTATALRRAGQLARAPRGPAENNVQRIVRRCSR